jgi:hypothetical protein
MTLMRRSKLNMKSEALNLVYSCNEVGPYLYNDSTVEAIIIL